MKRKYSKKNISKQMLEWMKILFPLNRSIAGVDNYKTLIFLKKQLPDLKIKYFKSGKKVFDWVVPNEWHIKDAYIKNLNGKKIIDFKNNNLHVVNYSTNINKIISNKELQKHLFSIKNYKSAIPYVTSYYKKFWGFCLSENQRKKLKDQKYKIKIESKYIKGKMHYGECYLKSKNKKEIFFSTNICHPSMANNELSGPVVLTALMKWISELSNTRYSYRAIFIPETIGSIAYIEKNKLKMKKNIYSGFNIVCVGDNARFSYLASKNENTPSDKFIKFVFEYYSIKHKTYKYLERGSDERQYESIGVNLPIASVMRSKYGTYKEYHTSEDNLNFISKEGLAGSLDIYKKIVNVIENNLKYKSVITNGEPFYTKYKLYPTQSTKETFKKVKNIKNIIAYSDGSYDLIDLSRILKVDFFELSNTCKLLLEKGLLKIV